MRHSAYYENAERKRRDGRIVGKNDSTVKLSRQGQITIPKNFYDALDIEDEALVEFTGKEDIIKSVEAEQVDFSVDILKGLTDQGYTKQELIRKLSEIKKNIPKALGKLKTEAIELPSTDDD